MWVHPEKEPESPADSPSAPDPSLTMPAAGEPTPDANDEPTTTASDEPASVDAPSTAEEIVAAYSAASDSAVSDAEPPATASPETVASEERILPLRMTPLRHRRRMRPAVWGWLASAALLILVPVVLASTLWPAIGIGTPFGGPPDQIPRGASAWATASDHTPLSAANSAFGSLSYPVDPQFAAAYAARGGQNTLGPAVTPAYTCNLGLIQFFTTGALLHEAANADSASATHAGDLDPDLARDGVRDPSDGVVWLALSHALLTDGSEAPIGGANSSATYVTLRAGASAAQLKPKPANTGHISANAPLPQTIPQDNGAFIVEGRRAGVLVGHSIPAPIWAYINQGQIAPNGWLSDIGEPVTEPLAVTVSSDGQARHLLAQVFWQTVILTDQDHPEQTWIEPVGLDYLRTVGAPTARITSGSQYWTTQDGALRSAAGASGLAVSLSANAAVTLTGATQWSDGALWYAARWSTPSRNGVAWVAAGSLSATKPTGQVTAGFDALSPSLASYLSGMGDDVGAVVYDVTRGVTYTYQPHQTFIMASSAKVPLMVSYLEYIEKQGRGPNSYERSILGAMIQHSDNNAAQVIYDTIGYDSGQQAYMRSWGITNYTSDPNGWGWGKWSPADMAHLLTLLWSGQVLNSSDRALAWSLMRSVESDQRFGVGDTAPAGATVAMKDGWVPGPDGAWAVNTSGLVSLGSESYIITVYTREQDSFGSGQNIVNHVCAVVANALT